MTKTTKSPMRTKKTATVNNTTTVATPASTVPVTAKTVNHNRKFPIVKVSRTKMVQVLNDTKGRFFTSTHIDKDGNSRTMNAIRSNRPVNELGYITVYSIVDKGWRNINPQTLTDLSFGGTHYKANRKVTA